MFVFFFFNDTATTEIYTLSLHDALPISLHARAPRGRRSEEADRFLEQGPGDNRCHCSRKRSASSERSEEHTSELQSPCNLVCRLLLEKKKKIAHRRSCCH